MGDETNAIGGLLLLCATSEALSGSGRKPGVNDSTPLVPPRPHPHMKPNDPVVVVPTYAHGMIQQVKGYPQLCPPMHGNQMYLAKLPAQTEEKRDPTEPKYRLIETESFGLGIRPNDEDVLIGTGRAYSSHLGNRRYQAVIAGSCTEYHDAKYKKAVVQRVIDTVFKRGGRFLAKEKGYWEVVTDDTRLDRNARKAFHMVLNKRHKPEKRQLQVSEPASPVPIAPVVVPSQVQPVLQPVQPESGLGIGTRIAVIWDLEGIYSIATIKRRNNNIFCVSYDDSDKIEWLDLTKHHFQVLPPLASEEPKAAKRQRRSKCNWTQEEDEALRAAVEKYGTDDWAKVTTMMPGRVHWQCRQRWTENLDPALDDKTPMEPEECRAIMALHCQFGNKWTEIAKRLPQRRSTKFVRHKFFNRIRPEVMRYFKEFHGLEEDEMEATSDGRYDYRDDFEGAVGYVLEKMPMWPHWRSKTLAA